MLKPMAVFCLAFTLNLSAGSPDPGRRVYGNVKMATQCQSGIIRNTLYLARVLPEYFVT